MTEEDREELNNLRKAITGYPQSVHPEKQARFTQLFVRSIEGKSDKALV